MHLIAPVDFSGGWVVASEGRAAEPVVLPHDAMIHERRDPHLIGGQVTGFHPGGRYVYRKTFAAPAAWRDRHVSLLFEGVYAHGVVRFNGVVLAERPSGYAEFVVDLDAHLRYGEDNELEVVAENTQPTTRWYSGSGLYRRVWLQVAGTTRFTHDGVRFRTLSTADAAEVEVEATFTDPAGAALDLSVELARAGSVVAEASTTSSPDEPTRLQLTVPGPALWSAEHPDLYELTVRGTRDGQVVAERRERVGIRTISADARDGLLVNGVTTLLRGGCLHHDNGVLGAATFRAAEFRRVRILKDLGFNAIRTGHTPISRDLLDACDEIGLYVMDELTDVWFRPKHPFDYARDFHDWWRRDLESMVAKDRNHASVIMYSIGNEIGESATDEGIAVGKEMAQACRDLDSSRLVTAGVNPLLNALASVGVGLLNMEDPEKLGKEPPKLAGSLLVNRIMSSIGNLSLRRPRMPRFDAATREIFTALDIAGYNYGSGQYRLHGERYPDRVMLGTETNPKDIAHNWKLVEDLPFVIGDFMWTAWDYLGEVGIGSWTYGAERVGFIKPYPWLTADCGAIDLIGQPTAAGLLARAVWGETSPAIVVRPPERVGQKVAKTPWRGTDAVASWSWAGREGKPTEVSVFSAAAEVELLLNGRSLGRRPTGRAQDWAATYELAYEPGDVTAVAFDASGQEVGRTQLRTAGELRLRLRADRSVLTADGQDLAFVIAELTDPDGVVAPLTGVALAARVGGAAVLAGFGSADPKPSGCYVNGLTHTFQGRALAVLRAGDAAGSATLTVSSDGYGEAELTVSLGTA